ncbi:hypothetical protein [Nibrella saemangeumensis]|uniref:hypothetical protein n=1 Tax=Nibrella saemangeumensis TaxID=1084526 RepID=UPI0031E99945
MITFVIIITSPENVGRKAERMMKVTKVMLGEKIFCGGHRVKNSLGKPMLRK